MGTRSAIVMKTDKEYLPGVFYYEGIYCHWDGYPSNNGKILLQHYNTPEKVKELIALGSLSSLREKINPDPSLPHTFDKPQEGVTVAYHRDRKEELYISKDSNLRMLLKEIDHQYYYLFQNGEWTCNGREMKIENDHVFLYNARDDFWEKGE